MAIPIVTLKLNSANGIIDVPIYSVADVADSSFRINTKNGIGCFDLVLPTSSTPFRVMTNDGIRGINTATPVIEALIVEDFMDDAYNLTFTYGTPYTFGRFDGLSPTGNSGYLKSTNQGIDASICSMSVLLSVPPGMTSRVEIDYFVDSEPTFDYLDFYLNDNYSGSYSGANITGTHIINLPTGDNSVRIEYSKDGGASTGTDTGYINEIRFIRE